ncbi:unnamed protein product [Pedinophyceae sp. YPF-701]|nr:unnamed protein product [Pedinophyceae sp. YPF-701]
MGKQGSRSRKRQLEGKHKYSLGEAMTDPEALGVRVHPRAEKRRKGGEDEDEAGDLDDIPGATRAGIMELARAQQREVEAEVAEGRADVDGGEERPRERRAILADAVRRAAETTGAARRAPAEEWVPTRADSDDDSVGAPDDDDAWEAAWEAEEEGVTEEDRRAMEAFMAPAGGESMADKIMRSLREQQAAMGADVLPESAPGDQGGEPRLVRTGLDPKVTQVYTGVGQLMSRYTSGRVPKAFKIIPSLEEWEEVLWLTDPFAWTPHAVYQATRMFSSNLNARMAQRFYSLVLLPRVRRDIAENRRLHFALFQALKQAFYKPAAWYRGILLPLCQSRTCTLREAVILSSVLKRVHVPVLHSAAALLRLAEMEYGGTTSFFIRVLLEKKYSLPYRVIDGLVEHFCRFHDEERRLPVVWHQSLLTFVQRYKGDLKAQDKQRIKALCKEHYHYQISPEVHRELDGSLHRGQRAMAAAPVSRLAAAGKEDVRNLPPVMILDD